LSVYPELLLSILNNEQPVTLVNYLFKLSRAVNSAFVQLQVKGSEQAVAEARMLLFEAARIVLRNGIELLGLVPVERM
jgi:arginyl-tRNA synthetase